MNRLFADLYRNRPREKKEAQEDWLTECLAATLNALTPLQLAEVLSDLTGQPLERISSIAEQVTVETQATVSRYDDGREGGIQRPDMLVRVRSQPWIVFENKVAAAVDEEKETTGNIRNQLQRYAEWISSQPFQIEGLEQAVGFITYHTPVPADFIAVSRVDDGYNGIARFNSSWGGIATKLVSVTSSEPEQFHSRNMAEAFSTYLKEYSMEHEYPTYQDIGLLANWIDRADSITKLVDDMFNRVWSFANWGSHYYGAEAYQKYGYMMAHRYIKASGQVPSGTYLATGIWFPDSGDGWYANELDETVSASPKVFLQLGNDDDDQLHDWKGLPSDEWKRPVSDFIVFRDFTDFPGDANARANAILAWVDKEAAHLQKLGLPIV